MDTKKQLVTRTNRIYGGTNGRKFITIHETANERPGTDAQAHANLQSRNNVRNASWHWSVDDHEAIQSFRHTAQCWHAGDGLRDGNLNSIAIEICENSDGDFEQAVRNAAQLTRQIMDRERIPLSHVRQHHHWSGKDCPNDIRRGSKAGITWPEFLDLVNGTDYTPTEPTPQDPNRITEDGWWGSNTTTAVQGDLDSPVDGEVWRQDGWVEDANPGLTGGWKFDGATGDGGSPMVHALHTALRAAGVDPAVLGTDDGKAGPKHFTGLQQYLKAIGYYSGRIDGVLDSPSLTVKATQRAHNDGALFKD